MTQPRRCAGPPSPAGSAYEVGAVGGPAVLQRRPAATTGRQIRCWRVNRTGALLRVQHMSIRVPASTPARIRGVQIVASAGPFRRRATAVLATAVLVACTPGTSEPRTAPDQPSHGRPTDTTSSPAATPSASPTLDAVKPFPPPKDTALPRHVARELDRAMRRALAGTGAGATAAVLTDRGSWTGAAGTGLRDERLTPEYAFPYASITKTFTAAEVVLLASRGLVDLHSPVSAYVPLPFQDNGATVEQVLRMRSGFQDSTGDTWGPRIDADPDVHITPAEVLAEVPPVPDPAGAPYRYTNTNYLLLGQLIERVTGGSYATALHHDLLDGHGLAGITVQDVDPPPHNPRALPPPQVAGSSGYLPSRGESSAAWSAGCLAGDASAVARWGYLLYGGRILQPDLVASMYPLDDGTGYGYGTLTSRSVTSNLAYVGHPGETGPYRTVLLVATDRPLAIAVLAAHPDTEVSPSAIADELVTALHEG